MSDTAILRWTVGICRWREVRGLLRQIQARHPGVTWTEGAGWLDRVFVIVGPASILRMIQRVTPDDGG